MRKIFINLTACNYKAAKLSKGNKNAKLSEVTLNLLSLYNCNKYQSMFPNL